MKRTWQIIVSAAVVIAFVGPAAQQVAWSWQVPDVGPSGPVLTLPVDKSQPLDVQVRNVMVNLVNQAGTAYDAKQAIDTAQSRVKDAQRELSQLKSEPPAPGAGETARREHQQRIADAQRLVDQRTQELSDQTRASQKVQDQYQATKSQYQTLQQNPNLPQIDPKQVWDQLMADKVPADRRPPPADLKEAIEKIVNWDGTGTFPAAALLPGPGRPHDPLPLTQRQAAAWEQLQAQHARCLTAHFAARTKLQQAETRRQAMEDSERAMTIAEQAMRDAAEAFNDYRKPQVDYSLYNRCPEGNAWFQCDHEDIKQEWLREQTADFEFRKMQLRDEYDSARNDYIEARERLEDDIRDYLDANAEAEGRSATLNQELAEFEKLLKIFRQL